MVIAEDVSPPSVHEAYVHPLQVFRADVFHPQDTRMNDHINMNMFPLSLQLKDHGHLLDVTGLVRSQDISRYIRLPQLIFCGTNRPERALYSKGHIP